MMEFHNDNKIKFEYDPQLHGTLRYLNAIGATESTTLRTLDFTPSDANSIYVKKTGSDSTGNGTAANPYLTIKKANTAVTSTKCNIVIADSGVYVEKSMTIRNKCARIVAAIGCAPTVKPADNLVGGTAINYYCGTIVELSVLQEIDDWTGWKNLSAGAHLSNGNTVVVYHKGNDLYAKFLTKSGSLVMSDILLKSYSVIARIYHRVCALSSGHFVIATSTWDGSAYHNLEIIILTNSGSIVYENYYSTVRCPSGVAICPASGYNDRFIVAMSGTEAQGGTHYMIIKNDGTLLKADTQISIDRAQTNSLNIVADNNGGFVVMYKIYNSTNYWHHINSSGTILHSGTVFYSGLYPDAVVVGNEVVFVVNTTATNLMITTFDLATHVRIFISEFTVADAELPSIVAVSNGVFCVSAGRTPGSIFHITPGLELIGDIEILGGIDPGDDNVNAKIILVNDTTNDHVVCFYNKLNVTDLYFTIKAGYLVDWWSITSAIKVNGIIFDNENKRIRKYLQITGGSFNGYWSTFKNISRGDYRDGDEFPLYILHSVGNVLISNCEAFNNDAGFKIASNSVTVQYSQFFKQLLNAALEITGAGSGIVINHCDFLYNYLPLKLIGNSGAEVIKNNIFFYSLYYSIYAAVAVSYRNSINTVACYNAAPGNFVVMSNPHYINDGYVDVDDIDLALKCLELGYNFASPAIGLADDGGNAGSVITTIDDANQTWTAVTVDKDMDNGVQPVYEPVGAVETVLKDGSVKFYKDSFTEVLTLNWRVVLREDWARLWDMYFCNENVVRVYLDPTTNPGTYNTYTLVRDKLNAFAKHPRLTRTGVENVSLTFKRAWNEGA